MAKLTIHEILHPENGVRYLDSEIIEALKAMRAADLYGLHSELVVDCIVNGKRPLYMRVCRLIESVCPSVKVKKTTPAPMDMETDPGDPTAELTTEFEKYKNAGYFEENAPVDNWLYICGIVPYFAEFRPLVWKSSEKELAAFVNYSFTEDRAKFKKACQLFTIKGRKLNPPLLRQALHQFNHGKDSQRTKKFREFLTGDRRPLV